MYVTVRFGKLLHMKTSQLRAFLCHLAGTMAAFPLEVQQSVVVPFAVVLKRHLPLTARLQSSQQDITARDRSDTVAILNEGL
jgi:hypothetical protein